MGFFGGGLIVANTANIANLDWYEEKTVVAGMPTFVLTNIVPEGSELLIINSTYGLVFSKGINYSKTGQVITIVDDGLSVNSVFQIWCFKEGVI